MKTPLSPAEVHKQYEEGVTALIKTIAEPTLRMKLSAECDNFFRSLALGCWRADGGNLTPGYVEYYNAIYHRGNPIPSILYWELSSAVNAYPGFTAPDFFHRMRAIDKVAGGDISRRFVDHFTLMGLLFASVDGTVSEGEAAFVNRCADSLSAHCDKDGLSGVKPPLDARDFVTLRPAAGAVGGAGEGSVAAIPDDKAAETPKEPEPTLEELLAELDDLVGLAQVKTDVKSAINMVKVRKMRQEQGLPVADMSLHLVFMGNPGTGKTTVARLLAKIYHAVGVLSQGQLVEVDRSGLVAGFVGQTALKTQEVCDKAKGGVLFIDEAYALTSHTGENDFGQEAVEVILKNMEDRRDDLIVIVAGYTDLMEDFIHSNPGLESRFNKYFFFEDYNGEQLLEIFKMRCKKNGYTLNDEAEACAKDFLQKLYDERDENFGNARDVRNYFEWAVAFQADRIAAFGGDVDKETLMALTVDDLKKAAQEDTETARDTDGEAMAKQKR